jgi:cytochrome c biogenesis protein CcdA
MKYNRKEIAIVGLSFTLSVFLTYLFIGLGFLKFVSFLQEIPFLNDIVYYAAIVFAAIIGLLNLRDYYRIKKGSLADMEMKLSNSLRQRINAAIRKNVKLRHYVLGALGMGFTISLLELACTGQVYLPTVLFIINTQGIQFRAILLLVAYNVAFIIPLIIIFIIFWKGASEKHISQWLTKHGANIKLAMGLLFIFLALFLYVFRF